MKNPVNPTESAILDVVQRMSRNGLNKRVPSIDDIDVKRIAFFIVQTRIDACKQAGIKQSLVTTLAQCGISTTAYYAWFEKYHLAYKQHQMP